MLNRLLSLLVFLLTLVGSAMPAETAAATPAATGTLTRVAEYYNANLGHYFMTGSAQEMAALDSGALRGWARTGYEFDTYPVSASVSALSPVCRFYGRPEAGLDSHFYSGSPVECAEVAQKFGEAWALESANVFYTQMPDIKWGVCPAGTRPVYRMFNNRADANHRYTTDVQIRQTMLEAGYTAEGYGEDLVAFCVPLPVNAIGSSASITVSASSNDTFSFVATATFGNGVIPQSYTWAFGDGSAAIGPAATHQYTSSGTYSVVLTVKGSNGKTIVTTRNVTAIASTPAVAATAKISMTVKGPATFQFNSIATPSSGAEIIAYAWNFGDGTTGTGSTTSHTYTKSGTHYVLLTVTDSKSKTATATATASAFVTTTAPPTATIAAAVVGSGTYQFDAVASAASGLSIASYQWTFGDGKSGSGASVTHTYAAAGSYLVTLTVKDSNGTATTVNKSVTVSVSTPPPPPPAAAPTASIIATSVGADTYQFAASASAASGLTIVSYAWTFGDGTSGTGASAIHTYAASGTFTVALTVKDSAGATTTTSKAVTVTIPVTPPPVIGAPGTWTKYAISYAAGNEAEYQSWYNLTYDSKRDVFYGVSWGGVIGAFSPTTGRWTKISPELGGGIHNRVTAYDPVNDRLWLGDGTGSNLTGVNYFDLNTKAWVAHPLGSARPGAESAMIYDPAGKRFIVFGGWFQLGVHTFSINPVANAMVSAGISGGPVYNSDATKMTGWRSDLDTKRNRIVYVDTDGSLWTLPLTLSGWQRVTPAGTPPPAYTQYVYDAANDAIVGWSASPRVAGGDTVTGITRETWLLPMSTMTWTKAASLAGGQTVPPDTVYVGYAMAYDPVRQQTILHSLSAAGNYDPSTWAYRYPTTGTNPPTTPPPPPAAAPTASITATGTASDTYKFDAVASAASGLTITSYAWTFGDGTSGTGASVTHTYTASGTYTASLTVKDSAGSATTVSKSVTASVPVVTPPAPPPPPPPPPPPSNVPTYTGKITSFPLPAVAAAPFSSVKSSKHTNMASDGNRIYVSGGDWVHSATDGTWSMSLADGTWRQDVGAPVYPTLPAPHALQDGAGFEWIASRQKFLLWPGFYFAYDPAGSPLLEYSKGMWWFDPVTNTYQQELAFFGTYGSSTGSVFGGVFDEVNEHIVEFGDSTSGFAAKRWDVKNLVRLPDVGFSLTSPPTYAAYFTRAKHVKIGRDVYIVGYRTNGNVSSQTPLLLRWNLDTQKMQELAIPPVDGTLIKDIEVRLATSHGKVVWPFMNGPEGNLMGIWIYDPATNVWKVDRQVPGYGNFIGNSVCSLPDGRVCFSGGVFGKQQTHMWFYEAL